MLAFCENVACGVCEYMRVLTVGIWDAEDRDGLCLKDDGCTVRTLLRDTFLCLCIKMRDKVKQCYTSPLLGGTLE